jgi:hypothetical protein
MSGPERPRKARTFVLTYEQRIRDGLETCRVCGRRDGLTVARIELDKPWAMFNAAILCAHHAGQYRNPRSLRVVRWRFRVPSLEEEELSRPAEERWGFAAIEAQRRRYEASRAAQQRDGSG